MHYSGLLVLCRPESIYDCVRDLTQSRGFDVYASDPATGRVVVVLETESLEEQVMRVFDSAVKLYIPKQLWGNTHRNIQRLHVACLNKGEKIHSEISYDNFYYENLNTKR